MGYVAYYLAMGNYLNSFNGFLTWFKLFKYLGEIGSFSLLLNLLSAAFNNLAVFSVIFLVVNLGFMHSFCLAFGLSMKDFSDPYMTFFTLIRLAMGDFDFHELYKTNRLLGPVLFLLYCVLTFFILVNVFIAIISDAFEEAKSMTQPSMIAKYFAMQLKKRLKHEKQSVAKIRMMVTEHLDDEIIDQAEILEIEEVMARCDLMDEDVA